MHQDAHPLLIVDFGGAVGCGTFLASSDRPEKRLTSLNANGNDTGGECRLYFDRDVGDGKALDLYMASRTP